MTSLLITHPSLSFHGGAELVITEFCRYLAAHNIPHDVLTTEVCDEIKELTPKTNYITIPPSWNAKFQTGTAYSFCNYLKTHSNWDVINSHNYPSHLAAASSKMPSVWLCNEPTAYHIQYDGIKHFSDFAKKSLLIGEKYVVKHKIEEVVVADQFNYNRFCGIYNRSPHIIQYGINYDFFSSGNRGMAYNKYQLEDKFVLLQVGLFTPLKNQMDSVRCLEVILQTEPSAVLILAGMGGTPYEQKVREYVTAHNLNNKVIFTGNITRDEIRSLYKAADIALFPVKSQGSWLSPFEALCAGTPVIVSPEITSSSLIHENEIGIISNNYPETVKEMIKNYSKYKNRAKIGQQWVRENLKWELFCKAMFEQCESVVHR